jgi:hypothetical protein
MFYSKYHSFLEVFIAKKVSGKYKGEETRDLTIKQSVSINSCSLIQKKLQISVFGNRPILGQSNHGSDIYLARCYKYKMSSIKTKLL